MRPSYLNTALVTGTALAFVGATALWPKVMFFVTLGTLSLMALALFSLAFLHETAAVDKP